MRNVAKRTTRTRADHLDTHVRRLVFARETNLNGILPVLTVKVSTVGQTELAVGYGKKQLAKTNFHT